MSARCKSCHKPVPDDARADALYCSNACRQREYRRRRAATNALREAPWSVIKRHTGRLLDDADSAADLDELSELLIKIARQCHTELQAVHAARGRFTDEQTALPDGDE